MTRVRLALLALVPLVLAGCSSDNCDLLDPTSCDPGLVCDPVVNDPDPHCFPPVEVVGQVVDATSGAGIGTAEVTAFDNLGAPASLLTFSGSDGTFTLRVPSFRQDRHGTPRALSISLFAAANNHLPYPSALQSSPMFDTGAAVQSGGGKPWVLNLPQTIPLLAAPPNQQNMAFINGAVELAQNELGVLVTAEANGQAVSTTFADGLGNFTLFNVPPGNYSIQAYALGLNYTAQAITVGSSAVSGLGITLSTAPVATLNGTVQVPPGDGGTSVNVYLESTFNPNLSRGLAPFGLRAPPPGTPPNVNGAFSIPGVPDGRYVVVPAVDNDGWVRDPSPANPTPIAHLVVSNGAVDVSPALKVVGAVQIVSPGGSGTIDSASATPTFTWTSYPGANGYSIELFDAFGNPIAFNPTLGASDTQVTYNGPPLTSGGLYQWRLTALDGSGNPISLSEDLKGIFTVQ